MSPAPLLSEAIVASRAYNAAAAALRGAAARLEHEALVAALEAEAERLEAVALATLEACRR